MQSAIKRRVLIAASLASMSFAVATAAAAGTDYCRRQAPDAYEPGLPLSHGKPAYPKNELNQSGEGWVRFVVNLSPEGVPVDIAVDDGVGGGTFIKISRDTLARWRYTPTKQAGRPVVEFGKKVVFEYRFDGQMGALKDVVIRRYDRARRHLAANDPKAAIEELGFALKFPMTTY